jgi:hypothetical protein
MRERAREGFRMHVISPLRAVFYIDDEVQCRYSKHHPRKASLCLFGGLEPKTRRQQLPNLFLFRIRVEIVGH